MFYNNKERILMEINDMNLRNVVEFEECWMLDQESQV